jgi:plastocyanin
MRLRKRYLPLAALLGAAVAVLPGLASGSAPSTASFTASDFAWNVSGSSSEKTVTIAIGGTVQFSYPSGGSVHNADFGTSSSPSSCTQTAGTNSGPVPPLPHVPTSLGWSGSCTFNVAGTYAFHCDAHSFMTGTITVVNPGEPTATTESASSVTETKATLKGTVNPNGQATEYFFKYGTTTGYGTETSPPQSAGAGTTNVPASAPAPSLAPGTTYHFELVATYASGSSTVLGGDRTFTTVSPPGAPTASTDAATSITETGATLKGTVNPNGEATKYVFNYGTSASYGQHSTELTLAAADHTSHPVSATLEGLAPGTTYHFRLVAKNASGTVPGADQMFMTTSPLPPTTTMTSTTTTTPPTTTTTTTTPLVEPPPGPPITGSPSLRSTQRGTSVKGSLNVSAAGAGGRLEVDLLAKSAPLARAGHSKQVRVGRFVHASVSTGKVSFSVALNARGKSALRRHHRLALSVKITLTPARGATVTVNRSVVLRA